jgi:hypothetical protein
MGRPRNPPPPPERMPWHTPAIAKQVDDIMIAMDAPAIAAETRMSFQRSLYRQKYFPSEDARGKIILTLRCILESEGNESAIGDPIIVSAVGSCLQPNFIDRGVALLEAFDKVRLTEILQTMRSLDLFSEKSIGHYYSVAIRNKLAAILEPAAVKPAKAKLPPKPPLSVSRIPQIERAISLGKELLALRAAIVCNKEFGRTRRKRFPDVDSITASESMKVARAYGTRPEIYRRLSWIALFELASPKMSPSVRKALEARILAGETITAPQIRKTRGRLPPGSPKRPIQQPALRLAA